MTAGLQDSEVLAGVVPTASSAAASQQPASGATISTRLAGVDGLRAIAALWVVLFHIHAFSGARFPSVPGLDLFLRSGSTGVSLFLVLSGFCLYLPFAGGRADRFKTGQFFVRRCRRLLPAYYVSLLFALALYLGPATWLGFPALSGADAVGQVLTHATLTHTLFPSTFFALNGAYWSLGLEWQLYLALPLLIWGVRRYGLFRTIAAVILCNAAYRLALAVVVAQGIVPADSMMATAVLPNQLPGRWAEFAYGMVAAELYATGRIAWWSKRGKLLAILLVPASLLAVGWPLSHMLYGCVFFVLLALVLASDNIASRLCAWPPLVAVGVMSYSLYLVHQPIVEYLAIAARRYGQMSPLQTFLLLLLVLPLIMLLAWILYMTVERHTLHQRSSGGQTANGLTPLATLASAVRTWRPSLRSSQRPFRR